MFNKYQAKLLPEEITRWSCNLVQFQNIEKYLIVNYLIKFEFTFNSLKILFLILQAKRN